MVGEFVESIAMLGEKTNEHDYYSDDKECMNEIASEMETESKQPQHEYDKCDSPKHILFC